MITFLSVVTSVKDYIEIAHKLIESDQNIGINNYMELGSVFTYFLISLKGFLIDFFAFNWLKNVWSLPILVPDIASAMVSEVSVLDGYFHNAFSVLENSLSYNQQNLGIYGFEKFLIGFINSFFLFIPTSAAHIIILRRFVMQGLEAGYLAGLGTIAGNVLWLTSIIFGWRFFVIPWLSFDIFRYLLGFFLLVKYMWDSSKERRMFFEDLWQNSGRSKIVLLNFLLALTEQTSIYPFLTNMSIGPEASILETFPAENYTQFMVIHGAYIFGILVGSLSLLQFTCWFWENPAFSLYLWVISSYGNTKAGRFVTSYYYKALNFTFTYLTMLCAICSIPYFGLDYTLTNPLGFLPQDRIIDQKASISDPTVTRAALPEVSFLGVKPTDKNTHWNSNRILAPSRHRWMLPLQKYRGFDSSLYGQGNYDFLTVEDLNYGFDRFWWRRKMREHKFGFRLFPGPWLRSLKIDANQWGSSLLGFKGSRSEFFRILSEQYYHPSFHSTSDSSKGLVSNGSLIRSDISSSLLRKDSVSPGVLATNSNNFNKNQNFALGNFDSMRLASEFSTLRKFVRNINTRVKTSEMRALPFSSSNLQKNSFSKPLYSKRWKHIYSILQSKKTSNSVQQNYYFRSFSRKMLLQKVPKITTFGANKQTWKNSSLADGLNFDQSVKKTVLRQKLSKKERQILRYRTFLITKNSNLGLMKTRDSLKTSTPETSISTSPVNEISMKAQSMTHPLKYYLQKEQAFRQKLQYYGSYVGARSFSVGSNAPYLRTILKRAFYYYKPTLRWERTISLANTKDKKEKRKTKKFRTQRKLNIDQNSAISSSSLFLAEAKISNETSLQGQLSQANAEPSNSISGPNYLITKPTHSYWVQGKRANRYRQQIYKDVLQHWYYMPWNRLFLKFDVDAFINRQPKSHFLTKKEEQLLHLRRVLLSEHYDTLRWYTYMQHYRSMKSRIGSTKSFASRVYNQQFQGTFKKIRHLFAITPSQEQIVLKFDQPLYNEFSNNSKASIVDSSVVHEELLADDIYGLSVSNQNVKDKPLVNTYPEDLISQSSKIVRQYLSESTPLREQIIQNFLKEKNYWELTEFLWKGQKIRGTLPITNQKEFLNDWIANDKELQDLVAEKQKLKQTEYLNSIENQNLLSGIKTQQWVKLLKESQRRLYARQFRKRFGKKYRDSTSGTFQSWKKYSTKKKIEFKKRLKTLKIWLISGQNPNINSNLNTKTFTSNQSGLSIKTSMQDAMSDSIVGFNNKNVSLSSKPLLKSKLMALKTKIKQKLNQPDFPYGSMYVSSIASKQQTLKSLLSTRYSTSKLFKEDFVGNYSPTLKTKISSRITSIKSTFNTALVQWGQKLSKTTPIKFVTSGFGTSTQPKNVDWWLKKQRALKKRKGSRKREHVKKYLTKEVSFRIPESTTNFQRAKIDGEQPKLSFNKLSLQNLQTDSKFDPQLGNLVSGEGVLPKFTKRKTGRSKRYPGRHSRKRASFAQSALEDQARSSDEFRRSRKRLKTRRVKKRSKASVQQRRQRKALRKRQYKKIQKSGTFKIKSLTRKLKRIKLNYQLQKWWWTSYLPNIQASSKTELSLTSLQKNKILQKNLSSTTNTLSQQGRNPTELLEIGDRDFKPLALPQALQIRQNLIQQDRLSFGDSTIQQQQNLLTNSTPSSFQSNVEQSSNSTAVLANQITENSVAPLQENIAINKLYENLFINKDKPSLADVSLIESTNPFPFYTGWDESKRKLVITTRYLSRREAGFEMKNLEQYSNFKQLANSLENSNISFTTAPLKGINKGFSFYAGKELPFNTYNMDQFIRTYQSFYAPIGWKRFKFRHSSLRNWFTARSEQTRFNPAVSGANGENQGNSLILKGPILSLNQTQSTSRLLDIWDKSDMIKNQKNRHSMTEKRNSAIRRTSESPMDLHYSPTGPLLTEVLPSHYLSVFENQSRMSRARYLTRLPKSEKSGISNAVVEYNNYIKSIQKKDQVMPDFTLRKRIKPKRKYHAKISNSRKRGRLFPRRGRFVENLSAGSNISSQSEALFETNPRWRPLGKSKKIKNPLKERQRKRKSLKARDFRRRQRNPREFRQVFKPTLRFQPRSGGFIWPGDYVRLESTPFPKLAETPSANLENRIKRLTKTSSSKEKNQKLPFWTVDVSPRKYLLQKHNIKLLKNKLEKAQRSNQIGSRLKELNVILSSFKKA